jgi:hypothetical protein
MKTDMPHIPEPAIDAESTPPNTPYWVWTPYAPVPGQAFVTEIDGFGETGSLAILRGEALTRPMRLVIKNWKRGQFLDQLGAYIGILLVTPRIAEVVEAVAGPSIQRLPVSVKDRTDLHYELIHVLSTVAALDRERSRFKTYVGSGAICEISKLAFKPLPPSTSAIFHLAEYPSLIIVDDRVSGALQAVSPHPGHLTPIQDWTNAI